MNYGPASILYLPPTPQSDITSAEHALRAALAGTEAVWLTTQGKPLFEIDLTGVVDDGRQKPRYLKMKEAQPDQD
jgi:hypothetical protein